MLFIIIIIQLFFFIQTIYYDFDQSKGLDVSNAIKKSSILLRKSSNKINQAIEYVNNSKRSSKISSSTISSGEGWRCLYCKNKNKNDMIKCWNCKRPRNIMQTIRDSNNNIKGNSGLFLNDIPLVNSIRDGSNLKDNIEFFFDKRNSSIDVLQDETSFKAGQPIPVKSKEGWLIVISQ